MPVTFRNTYLAVRMKVEPSICRNSSPAIFRFIICYTGQITSIMVNHPDIPVGLAATLHSDVTAIGGKCDPLAVGTPGRLYIGTVIIGQLHQLRAIHIHHKQVPALVYLH